MAITDISRLSKNYQDLDLDFTIHPVTKDISKKIGVEAVKRSIRNLVLTHFYERPFQPYLGCGIHYSLFENDSGAATRLMAERIKEAFQFEPRARLDAVDIDYEEDRNGVSIAIHFTILNNMLPANLTVFIERVR